MTDPRDAREPWDTRRFGVVLTLALLLRTVWSLWVEAVPVSDCNAYASFARTLARYNVYAWTPDEPSVTWPPGPSFIYSLLFRVIGEQYGPLVVLNVVIGVAIVGVTMLIARRWFGPRAAYAAGLIMAVWPTFIEFSTIVASELFFILGLLLFVLAWDHDEWSWVRRGALAGLACAFTCYMRPVAILLPAVFAGIAWGRGQSLRRLLPAVALCGAVMLACFAPWTVRNYRTFGEPVLISANSGMNLWMGNNPATTGFFQDPPAMPGLDEVKSDAELGRQAKSYILEHPGSFLVRTIVKAVRQHERLTIGVGWNAGGLAMVASPAVVEAIKWGGQAFWLLLLAAGVIGLWHLLRCEGLRRFVVHPTPVVWAYFTTLYAVFVIQDRYIMPAGPFIAMLAAVTACRLSERIRARGNPSRARGT